jgi:hypothetical protein
VTRGIHHLSESFFEVAGMNPEGFRLPAQGWRFSANPGVKDKNQNRGQACDLCDSKCTTTLVSVEFADFYQRQEKSGCMRVSTYGKPLDV